MTAAIRTARARITGARPARAGSARVGLVRLGFACFALTCGASAFADASSDEDAAFGRAFEDAFDAAYREELALAAARGAPAAPSAATPSADGAPGGTLLAVLDASATFGRGGAALPAPSRVAVERLARRLASLDRVLSVRIIGHADNVGSEADNQTLSERRARSVASSFRERWPEVHLMAVGAGESAPVADNATEAGRAANRRVEIQVIGIGRPD